MAKVERSPVPEGKDPWSRGLVLARVGSVRFRWVLGGVTGAGKRRAHRQFGAPDGSDRLGEGCAAGNRLWGGEGGAPTRTLCTY
jgi:hypothetical protein